MKTFPFWVSTATTRGLGSARDVSHDTPAHTLLVCGWVRQYWSTTLTLMLFGKTAKAPVYSVKDVTAIIEHNSSMIEQAVGCVFYFTNSGKEVITREQAFRELLSMLKSSGRTTIRQLSDDLDLGTDLVEELVQEARGHKQKDGTPLFYISPLDRTVLGQKELQRLTDLVLDLLFKSRGSVKLLQFCKEGGVDMQFVDWFVVHMRAKAEKLSLADDIMYDDDAYDKCMTSTTDQLEQQQKSFDLNAFHLTNEPDYNSDLVKLVKSRILHGSISVVGKVDAQGNYTPKTLGDEKRKQLQAEFDLSGCMPSAQFKKNKLTGDTVSAGASGKWTLSRQYIAKVCSEFDQVLAETGWINLHPEALRKCEYTNLARNIDDSRTIEQIVDEHLIDKIQRVVRPTRLQGKFIFTPNFDDKCRQAICEQWLKTIREKAVEAGKLEEVQSAFADDDAFTLREALLRHVSLPSDTQLAESTISLREVPQPLRQYLAEQCNKTLNGQLIKELMETASEELESKRREAVTKLELYVNGIDAVSIGGATQTKLCEELVMYAQQSLTILGVKPDSGLPQLREMCKKNSGSPEQINEAKQLMLTRLKSQLEKASQGAQVLHLALLIEFGARIAVDPPGMLRATGKYVPKLLKQIKEEQRVDPERMAIYENLKDVVVSKSVGGGASAANAKQLIGQVKSGLCETK